MNETIETTELVSTNPIKNKHIQIVENMLARMMFLLDQPREIKYYGANSDYYNTECLKLQIGPTTSLEITIRDDK